MNCSHQSPIVHQLPELALHGYPASYEYPLPTTLDPAVLATLHPWLRQVAILSPADAHSSLQSRWNGLHHDALRSLRDDLLEYDVTSVVVTGQQAWLLCVHPNGGFHLIGPPLDRNSIGRQQARWHFDDNLLLTEFLEHFGGLREDFAPSGGYFIDDQEWQGVNEPWMEEKVKGWSDWKDSLIVFSSRGGDLLLLHRSGRVGWGVADEVQMRHAYDNLDACLMDFARYRRVPWPFDPYEPRLDFFPRVS